MGKICAVCGDKFNPMRKSQIYCSSRCREISKRPWLQAYREETNELYLDPTPNLTRDAVDARQLGMTYGEFKAQQFLGIIPERRTNVYGIYDDHRGILEILSEMQMARQERARVPV